MAELSLQGTVDLNKLLEQGKSIIKELLGDHVIIVASSSKAKLDFAGGYNNSSDWAISDVAAEKAELVHATSHFSYAANYEVSNGKEKFYVQFACSDPIIGSNKIAMGFIDEPGNSPAYHVWEKMDNGNPVVKRKNGLKFTAQIKDTEDKTVWVFLVED